MREERKTGIAASGRQWGEEKGMRQGNMSYKNEDDWEGGRDEQMKKERMKDRTRGKGQRSKGVGCVYIYVNDYARKNVSENTVHIEHNGKLQTTSKRHERPRRVCVGVFVV